MKELGRPASASTPGTTPAGFSIDVAVLNMGIPTALHFTAQPEKIDEASGEGDTTHPKTKPRTITYSFR